MFEKLWSSLFDKGNVIFISFGLGLFNDGSDLLLLLDFSEFSVSVESSPVLLSFIFIFQLIVISSLISSVISMTKILLGVPLFYLLFLVYARIRICTIEVMANTQQVLAVPDQTDRPLQLHRLSQVTSCLTDFVYHTLWLIPESRVVDRTVYPFRNSSRSFWVNSKVLWLLRQPTLTLSALGLLRQLERRQRSIAAKLRTSWGTCLTYSLVHS